MDKKQSDHRYYLKNTPIIKQKVTDYRKKNPDKIKIWQSKANKNFYKNHKKTEQIRFKTWALQNKTWLKFKHLINQRRLRVERRIMAISYLGSKCVNCGISDIDCLQFDHINDDGYIIRKKSDKSGSDVYKVILNNIEESRKILQLLCANCNWKKKTFREELIFLEKINIPPF